MYSALARYYDLIHSSLTADRDFILKVAQEHTGPILELGCGTGRLLIPLARVGHTVTGVDYSPEMLARARSHLAREADQVRDRIDLIEGDIRNLSLAEKDRRYSLILLPYNTLLHFKMDEIQQLLRTTARHLGQDGELFIDVVNPFLIDQLPDDSEPTLEDTYLDQEVGETIRQFSQSQLYSPEQRLRIKWIFYVRAGSERKSERTGIEFDYWYYYPHQLQLMLQHAGYRIEQMLGDYDETPFTQESDRLIIISRQA